MNEEQAHQLMAGLKWPVDYGTVVDLIQKAYELGWNDRAEAERVD
jgi:hypothetical protein